MIRVVIDPETKLYHWNRGVFEQLSPHFSTREFECACGVCVDQSISSILVEKLESLRQDLGVSIRINSGYRCHVHQLELKNDGLQTASGISTHELGMASDISATGLFGPAIEKLASNYFQAIGVAQTWIHVDLRTGKVRRWFYT